MHCNSFLMYVVCLIIYCSSSSTVIGATMWIKRARKGEMERPRQGKDNPEKLDI